MKIAAPFFAKIAVALALSLPLVACADKKAQTQSDDRQELIVALDWVPNTNHTGLYVALENGYFAEQGFDAKIVQPSEDSASVLVAAERADFGVYFQPNMVKRLAKGEPITAVAAVVQDNTAGLLANGAIGATSPKDLRGLRYSTWEDPVDDKTVASVVGEPLNPIPGEVTDAASAFRLNQFDYILAYYAWDKINADQKGVATDFFYLKDADPVFNYYTPVIIANTNRLAADPTRHKKALQAIKKGYLYAAQNPNKAAEILLKHAPETNAELVFASQAYLSPKYLDKDGDWGKFDYARWDRFFDWAHQNRLVDTPFAPRAGVSNDYLP